VHARLLSYILFAFHNYEGDVAHSLSPRQPFSGDVDVSVI